MLNAGGGWGWGWCRIIATLREGVSVIFAFIVDKNIQFDQIRCIHVIPVQSVLFRLVL